ncbi:MAG: ubiquinol-cytochrome c reductase iron-sulfur subunit [Acidobacteriaceae bacterium]
MSGDQNTATGSTRRRAIEYFLGGGILATFASFLYPVLRYVVPPPVADLGVNEVVAGKVGDLKPNTGAIFRFGSSPGLLILSSDGTYQALSATCTHLGCTVQYRGDLHEVWCPCHNGIYGIDGRNISGPPPKPLEAYDVHLRGDEVVVTIKREA